MVFKRNWEIVSSTRFWLSKCSKTSITRARVFRVCDYSSIWIDLVTQCLYVARILIVRIIFTSQNHPKCKLKKPLLRAIKTDCPYMYYCGTKVQSFNIRPAKQIYIAYMYIYTVKHMYNSFQIRKRRLDMHLQLLYKDHW